MGCTTTKDAGKTLNLAQEYQNRGLPQPWSDDYKTEFEKEGFMAINLIRNDPKFMIPHIKSIKSIHLPAYPFRPQELQGHRNGQLAQALARNAAARSGENEF